LTQLPRSRRSPTALAAPIALAAIVLALDPQQPNRRPTRGRSGRDRMIHHTTIEKD
jgi:hypothetical protein